MFKTLPINSVHLSNTVLPNLYCVAAPNPSNPRRILVTWGTVNNMRADVTMAFGGRAPFYVYPNGSQGYIYIEIVANLKTRKWLQPTIISSTTEKVSKKTTYYKLIGTYSFDDNALSVVSWEGGDVNINFCDLPVVDP